MNPEEPISGINEIQAQYQAQISGQPQQFANIFAAKKAQESQAMIQDIISQSIEKAKENTNPNRIDYYA